MGATLEKDLTKVLDIAYFRAVSSTGESCIVTKENMASVLAGLINPLVFMYNLDSTVDFNSVRTSGIYFNAGSLINVPTGYGTLIVTQIGGHILQLYFNTNNEMYHREFSNNAWKTWVKK